MANTVSPVSPPTKIDVPPISEPSADFSLRSVVKQISKLFDELKIGLAKVDATVLPTFPSGTKVLFYQSAAPAGWTQDTAAALNDAALRVVNGAGGGAGAGATVFTSVFGAGKTTGSHTLTTSQIPAHTHTGTTGTQSASHTHSGTTGNNSVSHTHTVPTRDAEGANVGRVHDASAGTAGTINTSNNSASHTHSITTGNQSVSHTHSFTTDSGGGTGGSHNHTLSLDLKYATVIVATKD